MVTYEKENPMTTTLLDFEEYALKRGRQEGRQEGLQSGLQKGRQEGRQEGLQEGRAGIQRILRHQLQRRFGELPEWAEARLGSATLEDLESWGERILDAVLLEDIFA